MRTLNVGPERTIYIGAEGERPSLAGLSLDVRYEADTKPEGKKRERERFKDPGGLVEALGDGERDHVLAKVERLKAMLEEHGRVTVNCTSGLYRSSVIVCVYLVKMHLAVDAVEAVQMVDRANPGKELAENTREKVLAAIQLVLQIPQTKRSRATAASKAIAEQADTKREKAAKTKAK